MQEVQDREKSQLDLVKVRDLKGETEVETSLKHLKTGSEYYSPVTVNTETCFYEEILHTVLMNIIDEYKYNFSLVLKVFIHLTSLITLNFMTKRRHFFKKF